MIRFSYILRFIVFLFALCVLFSYRFFASGHLYFNLYSLLLIESICLFIFYTSGKFSTRFPLIILFNFLIILFVVSRIFVLILKPDEFVGYGSLNSEMMNSTLLFIFLGIMASTFGVKFGCSIKNRFSVNSRNLDDRGMPVPASVVKFLVAVFLLTIAFQMLNYYMKGYAGATGSGETLSFFWRYPARLLNPIVMIMVLFAAYIVYGHEKPHKWAKHRIVFCAVLLVLFLLAQASRSGLFEIAILFLVFNIAQKGNFRIRLSLGKMILILLAVPFSMITYVYASSLRVLQWSHGDTSLNSYIANYSATIDMMKEMSVFDIMSPISYRLNSLRQIVCVMHGENMGLNDISHMVNVKTTLLSSLDRMVPGNLFEGIMISEYAFGFMYRPEGIIASVAGDSVNYVGYEWNVFGISYQLFGYFGGIVFIFLVSALFGYLINFCIRKRGLWGYSFGILGVYSYYMWITNYGIDNLIDKIWSMSITMTFFLICIEIIRELPRYFKVRGAIQPPHI